MCASTAAFAQNTSKPASEKWRPKDGKYVEAGTDPADPCEDAPGFVVELSKEFVGVDELAKCRVTKFVDTAPGALRINMVCSTREDSGADGLTDYKEVMTLRRIDDQAFFMHWSYKGKFIRPEWRVDFCPRLPQ